MMRSVVLALLLAACGGKAAAPEAPADHHEGAQLPPQLATFHDVAAPHWEAAPGPPRVEATCAALADIHAAADALATATPPTTANADTWTTDTNALVAAVTQLDTGCRANDAAQVDAALAQVHDSFHALMTAAGLHHE